MALFLGVDVLLLPGTPIRAAFNYLHHQIDALFYIFTFYFLQILNFASVNTGPVFNLYCIFGDLYFKLINQF